MKLLIIKPAAELRLDDELVVSPWERPRPGMPDLISRVKVHGVTPSGEMVYLSHDAGSTTMPAGTLVAVFVAVTS